MKFHIVREGETINDIMFLYSITEDELKEDNRHIRRWDKLIPGTKLKISVITRSDDEDILQMEPFIEDYYPKDVKIEEDVKVTANIDEIQFKKQEDINEKTKEEKKIIDETVNVNENNIEINNKDLELKADEIKNGIDPKEHNYIRQRKNNYFYYPYVVYYPVFHNPYNNYYYIKKRRK